MNQIHIRCIDGAVVLMHREKEQFFMDLFAENSHYTCQKDISKILSEKEEEGLIEQLINTFDNNNLQKEPFTISVNDPIVSIKWIEYLANGISVIKGEFELHKCECWTTQLVSLLKICSDQLKSQNANISMLTQENLKLKSIAESAVTKYSEAVKCSQEREKRQFTAFARLLNTKKAKITDLQQTYPELNLHKQSEVTESDQKSSGHEDDSFSPSTDRLANSLSKRNPLKTNRSKKQPTNTTNENEISFDDLI